MLSRIAELLRRFRQSQDGGVALYFGLIIFILLGMGALASEIGLVLYKRQQQQTAADAAAYSAAVALSNGESLASITNEARAIAASVKGMGASSGFVQGVDGVNITVNNPPTSGSHVGDTTAVEVIIQQPQTLSIVALVSGQYGSGPLSWNVTARGVATAGSPGAYCVVALDPTACESVHLDNNVIVQSLPCGNNCGVGANSSCSSAIALDNNAQINGPVSTVGNWSLDAGAKLNCTPKKAHAAPITDPYAGVPLPPSSVPNCVAPPSGYGCSNSTATPMCTVGGAACTASNGATVKLAPGHYLNGWNFSNGQTLNLDPGIYYIDKRLSVQNGVTVNAPPPGVTGGVTLIINGNYAIQIGNNATLNITAPTSGTYTGIAIASNRNATSTVTQEFDNNAYLNITGAIYFPNQIVQFDNNGIIAPTLCTQVIARMVNMENNATLKSGCPGTGIQPAGGGNTQLVE